MTSVSEDEAELWTIPHLLKNQAVRRPNDLSCCSIDGNLVPQVQFTWKTLAEAAERIGRAVSGFPGERFLLPFAGPSPQFAASFFGTLLGGAIPVVVPPPMKSGNASRLMHCVGDC
ncbi:MAG TPA: hypothetical protein P5307_29555, partial [Pirellulaceae bacterium]|nr:hypothetical protein [Pirellulaceae bacterium]